VLFSPWFAEDAIFLLFFFLADMLSCPESDEFDSELELDELELLELLESELESDAWPELVLTSILSATAANSGISFLRVASHFLLSFGLPRTVLCHTIGKLVIEQKF